MTIYGLGGCGKSALATEFAYRVASRRARLVFWVPAISQESFETAYREIGARLRIPGIADDSADVKKLVQTTLDSENMADWLMIVDNADDHDVLLGVTDSGSKLVRLRDYLPRSSRGSILFTTRSRKLAEALTPSSALEVTDMGQADVEQLLMRRISKKILLDDEPAVNELLILFTNLPLAIVQAAAFMNNNDMSVRDYISLFCNAETETELFNEGFEDPSRYDELDNTIAKTWQISFEQIRKHDQLAADYLSFMACVDRINIPQSLLPPATSPVQQMKALGTLKGYAFITEQVNVEAKQGGGKFYDVHRLVHMASAHWLQKHDQRTTWIDVALARLKDVVPHYAYEDFHNRVEWMVCLPHALYVANLYGVEGTLASADILYRVGLCQASLGQYSAAEITFRRVLVVQKKELGLEHLTTLETQYRLADVLNSQGVYAEAENIIRKTIELAEKVLGGEHINTLQSIGMLAVILSNQGMHAEAEEMHCKMLELKKKVSGEEDRSTLWSMNHLAMTLNNQGKYAEAEKIYRETLELKKKVLGEEDLATLAGMGNLAGTLNNQGKCAEAERIYRKTLELRKKVSGEEHPDTLITMGSLGLIFKKQGRYDESCTLLEQACAGFVKVLGEYHHDTRWCCDIYREVLELREQNRLALPASGSNAGNGKKSRIRRGLARMGIRTSKSPKD